MRLPRFRIRTLMLLVAVVALQFTMVPLLHRTTAPGVASDDPRKVLAICIWTVLFFICNGMMAVVVRDIMRKPPH